MPYCTQQDLIDRFGEAELIQLTDRNQLGLIDGQVTDRAIGDASAEIDGYLAGRYDLPLMETPQTLVRMACDVARYYLFDDRAPEQIKTRYDNAIRYLNAVAKGDINIGVSAAGDAPAADNGATIVSDGRTFGRDDQGFI